MSKYKKKQPKPTRYIEQRKSSIRVLVPYTDETGSKKRYSKSFKRDRFANDDECLAAAIRERDSFLRLIEASQFTTPTVRYTFEKSKQVIAQSFNTQERYKYVAKDILEKFGETPLPDITAADIQSQLADLASYRSNDFIKRVFAMWRRIYKTANICGWGITDKTVTVQVPKSKKPAKPKRQPVTEELMDTVEAILDNYDHSHSNARTEYNRKTLLYLFRMMRHTGMRPAEVLALTESDIDFSAKTISISKAVGSTYSEKVAIIPCKTEQSRRVIPMTSTTEQIISEAIARARSSQTFARYDGELWDIDDVSDSIHKMCKARGIEFRLYDLRHAFAKRLFDNMTPPEVIRDLMGHDNTTMSISYASSSPEDLRRALLKSESK